MTREENIAKLAELRASAEEMTRAYNNALQEGNRVEYMKLDEQISDAIGEYTALAKSMCYAECMEQPDPLRHAVSVLTFRTIAAKDKKTEDDKIPVRSIEDRDKVIDLLDLDKFAHKGGGSGIGHDPNWVHVVQQFNCLLTAQKAVDLGINPKEIKDSYNMSAIAREIDMGKTPTSKTNILRTLQKVITAMLGEECKATSHDVNYLLSVYSKKGRAALAVSCSNHRHLTAYLARVCHRIITPGAEYSVEYQKRKE